MWKFWLKFFYFHYLISALILHSFAKLRNFTLLQDLIQKYEGDLSQLSKRCEEMKKLYSSVLVRLIVKCSERNLNFLRKEEKCRSSHAPMCLAVILSTRCGCGWNVLKDIVFLFLRIYNSLFKVLIVQKYKCEKVDVQNLKFSPSCFFTHFPLLSEGRHFIYFLSLWMDLFLPNNALAGQILLYIYEAAQM